MQIEQNDILIFKNGMSMLFHENQRWILYAFYDENLTSRRIVGW